MHLEYGNLILVVIMALTLSSGILGVSYVFVLQKGDIEKVSPYECGFQPFEDARQEFDVRFYVVALLFLIFDLEIAYLFPWSIVVKDLAFEGYWTMVLFLVILTLGFGYEWVKGALDW